MGIKFPSSVVCFSVAAMLLLSGCSNASPEANKSSDDVVLDIPDSNPWKEEISEGFTSTNNSFVRQVLADGVITDAEGVEAKSAYEKCLAIVGVKLVSDRIGGAEEHLPIEAGGLAENPRKLIEKCNKSTGYDLVGSLYYFTKNDPNNGDPVEFMLECLQDRGVVEKGVKIDQFREKYEDWDYMNAHREDFDACDAKPKV